jgi:hypothetical protein
MPAKDDNFLEMSILGQPNETYPPDGDENPEGNGLGGFGLGDLAPGPSEQSEPGRRSRERSEWGGFIRAITADHSPSVGLRFRAWAIRHADLIAHLPTPQQLAMYVELATFRDTLADELRSDDAKEYDWAELHLEGLRPMIEAEMQAQREEIAGGVRQAMLARLKAYVDKGQVSPEVLEAMMAGVSNG